ncbi:MAG: M20 family metallopeptidase [Silvibacterium sp.]|nr:M20 family metallopeptidase [Silvibacterium sp.]MBV8438685.1 M20 family metallopeptidase [Silvibacterium sp.]
MRDLVELESPSHDKAAVDRCVGQVERECARIGGRVRRHRQKKFGDLLEVRFGRGGRGAKPVMLLGHLDTVWEVGTLAKMPFKVADGRVWGPGTLDMKCGVAMALTAIEYLLEMKTLNNPLILLLVSDEEIGSPVSRPVTEKLARECEAVYVLEPAQGLAGAYKTARKGVGEYTIHVQGVAAHSGVDFERGHSAIAELARQVGAIQGFTELSRGITVNVGTIEGGTRSNVVAAEARATVDVRIAKAADSARVERKFRRLRAVDRGCVLMVEGGLNRPPMERTRGTVELFRRAATLAKAMGFGLEEAATGGGSDGNFTSAMGIPTLDGMGGVGEGAHAAHESVILKDLAPRTVLLAAMLLKPEG